MIFHSPTVNIAVRSQQRRLKRSQIKYHEFFSYHGYFHICFAGVWKTGRVLWYKWPLFFWEWFSTWHLSPLSCHILRKCILTRMCKIYHWACPLCLGWWWAWGNFLFHPRHSAPQQPNSCSWPPSCWRNTTRSSFPLCCHFRMWNTHHSG
jgi:hypothetical protein